MFYTKDYERRLRMTPAVVWLLGMMLGGAAGLVFILLGVFLGPRIQVDPKTAWHITRATGVVAYLLLTAAAVWGLALSSKIIKEAVPAPLTLDMHNTLSWLAIWTTAVHVFGLLFDSYYQYRLADLFIPFIGPYRPLWVGLGVIGLYLMAATSLSFGWRKRIGQAWWRRLHSLTFAAYGLVTLHGLMAGTDSVDWGMKAMFLGSTLLVLFMTNYRLLTARQKRRRRVRSG